MVFLTSRKSLLLVFATLTTGALYRALHFATTGFYPPDEFGYTWFHLYQLDYQGRQFFQSVNALIFWLFQIDSPDRLAILMPFYFMLWASIGIIAAYKTMKLFNYEEKVISATLLLSLTIPVFLLFSATVLSEPVAFALSMVGIWCVAKFMRDGGYQYPFLAALFFVATAYTRVDFIVFQALGFVPFAAVEFKRSHDWSKALAVAVIFITPATVFTLIPTNSVVGTAQALASIAAATHQLPATLNASSIKGITSAPPAGNIFYNAFRFVMIGMILGFNPIAGFLLAASFFFGLYAVLKRKENSFVPFLLGILALGTFAGTVLVYSVVPDLPTSTAIRYSYDISPAFFVLVPRFLSAMKSPKPFYAIAGGILLVGALGGAAYPAFLQTNLTTSYPFLHGENFLGLGYRVPYAQMRDYFHNLPPQRFYIVGATKSLDENISNDWRFTPGVSDIKITFYPYNTTAKLNHFYLYLEPGWERLPENQTVRAFLDHVDVKTIFDTQSFYLGEVP